MSEKTWSDPVAECSQPPGGISPLGTGHSRPEREVEMAALAARQCVVEDAVNLLDNYANGDEFQRATEIVVAAMRDGVRLPKATKSGLSESEEAEIATRMLTSALLLPLELQILQLKDENSALKAEIATLRDGLDKLFAATAEEELESET
jgi:hypothetical protein